TRTDSTRRRVSLDRSSVENLNLRPALRLYPNPTRGSLTLEFPATERSASIRVLGTDGKVYLQRELRYSTLGQEELDFSDLLPTGLYLLEYRGPLGRNLIRFVKN
ncbi:MAG: T9SS type A sorting domain-containing protein, partial [Bacteroidota bacterium]